MAAGTSSSFADRIGRQYEQETGREASANDPRYAEYVQRALPAMIAADRAERERSQRRWKVADRVAYAAAAVPFAFAAAPVVAGAFGGGAPTTASVPGVVSGAPITTASQAAALGVTGTPTVVGSTGSLAGLVAPTATTAAPAAGFGGGTFGATAPVFGSVTPTAATGLGTVTAPTVGSTAATTGGGGMAMGIGDWITIGKEGVGGLTSWLGNRSANNRNDQAAAVAAQGNDAMVKVEQDKLAEQKRQFDLTNAANDRNFQIKEEERLEELKRQNEEDAAREPIRLARESAYRIYMKKYYGIDVGPSVGKSPREIATSSTKQPLAAQAAPGAGYGALVAPETQPAASAAPDPFMQSWMAPSSEVTYRRKFGAEEAPSP